MCCRFSVVLILILPRTTKSEMDFMQAVKTGHVDRVCSFIQQGTDVNSQDQYGNTALHYAAHAGKLDMVRLLLTNEANIISKNKSGLTPLHFAAFGGSQQVLRELLQRRPDCIDLQSDKGFSLLHEAVRGKHVKTVEVLLEEKADSNLKDKNGNTPLHMAVSQKSLQICRCILKHTPDLQLRNQDENTCLHLAASVGSLQICQLLLDQDSSLATARDKNGESFLFHAVRGSAQSTDKGYVELVRQILENSGCVLYRNEAGLKVLDVARLTATPVPILHLISEKTEEQQSSDLAKSCQQLKNRPVKLFICGHCGVGKTTLVNALHRKEMGWLSKYQFLCGSPEAPPSTKGVNITYSNLAGISFVIWDFAGQMEYYFTHSLLLATSSSNVIYCLVFSLEDIYCHKDGKQLEALHQVQYWLRFLNVTRMNQAAGKSQVFLVGSHYDKLVGASRSEIAQQFFKLLKGEAKELLNCFDVHYCYMNCTDSSQLEPLCQKLDQAAAIVQSSQKPTVPIICQRVMEEVRQLTICGKVKFILWREFVRTVEQNLADHSEEQLRTAVEYLHNISELLFFPSVCSTHIRQNGDEDPPSTQGILVLDLQWLGNDIFGTFGNVPSSFSLQKQERWSQQDLANLLYLSSTEDLKVVLELLEVLELIVCPGGKEEYIIPAWLTREKGEDIWVESKCSAYYGVAYRWRKDYGLFSQAFFARLQLRLLKQFTSPGEERFRIWKDGIECVDEAKVLAQVSTDRRVINVVGHGLQHNPRDHRALDTKAKCWQLLTVVSAHVEKLLAEAHADSDWDKLYLSPRDMSQRQDSSSSEIAVYTYHDILAAEQQQRSLYSKTSACEDKPWEVLMAGYDVTILSSLERSARVQWLDARTLQELCGLLDPEHPLGKDWKNLMEILGDATSQDIETLESRASRENCSPTRLVFQKFPVTIDRLYSVLKAMGREDCLLEIDSMFHSLKSDPECELLHSS